MNWSTFYDKYLDWEEDKLIRCIEMLENFGPNDEIIDAVNFIYAEKACSMLIEKAMNKGIIFSIAEIKDIMDCVDANTTERLILKSVNRGEILSDDDIDEFEFYVGGNFFKNLFISIVRNNPDYTPMDILRSADYISEDKLKKIALSCKKKFTEKELDELACYLDEDFMKQLYKKYGYYDDGYYTVQKTKKDGVVKRFYHFMFVSDTLEKLHNLLKLPF